MTIRTPQAMTRFFLLGKKMKKEINDKIKILYHISIDQEDWFQGFRIQCCQRVIHLCCLLICKQIPSTITLLHDHVEEIYWIFLPKSFNLNCMSFQSAGHVNFPLQFFLVMMLKVCHNYYCSLDF